METVTKKIKKCVPSNHRLCRKKAAAGKETSRGNEKQDEQRDNDNDRLSKIHVQLATQQTR